MSRVYPALPKGRQDKHQPDDDRLKDGCKNKSSVTVDMDECWVGLKHTHKMITNVKIYFVSPLAVGKYVQG